MDEEGKDLSGWFVPALITPLGLDKLTDCHTHTLTDTEHTHSKIFLWSNNAAFCPHAPCVCVCERTNARVCVCARGLGQAFTGVCERKSLTVSGVVLYRRPSCC